MANLRFAVSMQRLIPFLGFHHILMLFQTTVIILLSIILAGCSSYSEPALTLYYQNQTMTNIYLFGLSYVNTTSTELSTPRKTHFDLLNNLKGSSRLEVRAGYFGICVRQQGVLWLCSSDTDALSQQIGSQNDPLDLIGAASDFKDGVIFSGLIFGNEPWYKMAIVLAFFSTLLLATFPGWHEERDERTGSDVDVRPFPSRPVSQVALSAAFVAAVLLLTACLWQHVGAVGAAAMAEIANVGNVGTSIGTSATVMAWIAVVLQFITVIGLLVMILSIIVLDRLTDND
ncbi:Ca2+ regulator and membrane fusion protein Fig1-domain-containing protein [Phaeosphaeria sp. MPI-PUGE-AT-0046c]|nr:Ca2+ regulator and membrane fusion protein Fig1-domain-containing protein [Phaeosphaeria sp. MPI-PUGE-AT-0046c]